MTMFARSLKCPINESGFNRENYNVKILTGSIIKQTRFRLFDKEYIFNTESNIESWCDLEVIGKFGNKIGKDICMSRSAPNV